MTQLGGPGYVGDTVCCGNKFHVAEMGVSCAGLGVAGPDNIRGPIPSWEVPSCVRLGWGQCTELGVHVRQVWGSTCRCLGYLGMTGELPLNFPDRGRGGG